MAYMVGAVLERAIKRFQNKVRNIVNAPRYVRNRDRYKDLGIKTVDKIINKFAEFYESDSTST